MSQSNQINKKNPWFAIVISPKHQTNRNIQPKQRAAVDLLPTLPLKPGAQVFFMGSCFGQEMHQRLLQCNHSTYANPFGVIFHPLPLLRNLRLIQHSQNHDYFIEEYNKYPPQLHQNVYHSLQHANRFQNPNSQALEAMIYTTAQQALLNIQSCDLICITLGTAWLYQHILTDNGVGNCHKLPQQDFKKILSTHQEIKHSIANISDSVSKINPHANLIFTVSPVKHLRDGLSQNLQSKSTLISALNEHLQEQKSNPRQYYFPAYEIIQEELNDWKFFKSDQMHPTDEAIDEVFKRFYNCFFPNSASTLGALL